MKNIISTNAKLAQFIQQSRDIKLLALDTEFFRRYSYYAKLCLIQVNNGTQSVIIDPLAPDLNIAPFLDFIYQPHILKVFHAARQDLEIFFHLKGKPLTPIFDTQIVATACGFDTPPSYEKLVRALCKIQLDKNLQAYDWRKRPLEQAHLDYALSDVIYLIPVYQKLCTKITELQRGEWIQGELDILTNPKTYQLDFENLWRELRGIKKYRPKMLAILKEITIMRERLAIKYNVPRSHILSDPQLVALAEKPIDCVKTLRKNILTLNRISNDDVAEFGKKILLGKSPEKIAAIILPDTRENLSNTQQINLETYKILRRLIAEKLKISPKLLGNVDILQSLATEGNLPQILKEGWRYEHFGQVLEKFIRGEYQLMMRDNKLTLEHKIA